MIIRGYNGNNKVFYQKLQVGTKNPTVKLRALRLDNLVERPEGDYDFINLEPPAEVTEDHILGGVRWVSPTEVAAQWLNRRQNHAVLVIYDVTTRSVVVVIFFGSS